MGILPPMAPTPASVYLAESWGLVKIDEVPRPAYAHPTAPVDPACACWALLARRALSNSVGTLQVTQQPLSQLQADGNEVNFNELQLML